MCIIVQCSFEYFYVYIIIVYYYFFVLNFPFPLTVLLISAIVANKRVHRPMFRKQTVSALQHLGL